MTLKAMITSFVFLLFALSIVYNYVRASAITQPIKSETASRWNSARQNL